MSRNNQIFLMSGKKGNPSGYGNLGYYFYKKGEYEKAIEYYLLAIEGGIRSAMNNLGWYYFCNQK